MTNFREDTADPATLNFDLRNPRMPDHIFGGEEEAIQHLVESASLTELVDSISSSGWMDYEPLIVLTRDERLNLGDVVVEGNRRLAVLRLLGNRALAARLGQKIPLSLHPSSIPREVRIWRVESRAQARDFIGFKHINGAFKWDSFAKAKYAAEWLEEEPDLPAVSRRLGDTHNTVARLVNGYRVLQQSERQGFDRAAVPGRFAFSHLYTGLTRPSIRSYVGLDDAPALLEKNPVPDSSSQNLQQLMLWLYGQGQVAPVIKSQNPDLKRLASVLESGQAVAMLIGSHDLDEAFDVVEDKSSRFASELSALLAQAKAVSAIIGNYDGDPDLVDVAALTFRTVRSIQQAMLEEAKEPSARPTER